MNPGQQYWFRAQSIDIDTADYFAENIGESLLSFTPMAIPEPASHILAIMAAVIGLVVRRVQRARQ